MSSTFSLRALEETDFESAVLAAAEPSLLLFGGEACIPCRSLDPQLAELASAFIGRAHFFHVDAAKSPELAARFQVRGLPTVLILKAGNLRARLVGQKSMKEYRAALEACLA